MKRFLAVIIVWLAVVSAAAPLPAQGPGVDLFFKGRYAEAYAALWPELSAGRPEAAFYGLIIRRNGLDGRAPARGAEMAALWRILNDNAELMRRGLNDPALPTLTKDAYRTALVQLEYFGPTAPPWPPKKISRREPASSWPAATKIGATVRRFTPAMNFQAFLDLEAHEGRETSGFNHCLKAAEAGDHLAMTNLAWLYRQGLGRPRNNLRSAHWARKGSEAVPPVARAMNEMGACYESGRGVTADSAEASRWYGQAAGQGYGPAIKNQQRLKDKSAGGEPELEKGIMF